ncbi:DUF6351 family protein [Microbacter sp. GSS18]|nr:DUF6351 family protein [Microbacter sp. GSS18]
MKTKRMICVASAAAIAIALGAAAPSYAEELPPQHAGGTLPDGRATWVADVPADWTGTLVLFSHGYSSNPSNPATNAPNAATAQGLLDQGYAIAGSSYERPGWTLDTAAQDQLETLEAFVGEFGEPTRVIALGQSMGGLVAGQLAESAGGLIDGAVPMCGLMSGGVQLLNYQTDGLHALAELITPGGSDLKLGGFSGFGEAAALVGALNAAVATAETTPEGRARLALASAFFQLSTSASNQSAPSKDADAIAAQQLAVLKGNIPFFVFARYDIEQTLGGNSSWNVGVDYKTLFQHTATRSVVEKLYRASGVDLREDLERLTETADLVADPAATERADEISGLDGQLEMPVLAVHTLYDTLVPAQIEEEYQETVREANNQPLLRQAYIDRVGHCAFTPAEYVAAVNAMNERLETGHWTPASTPQGLDRSAEALDLGESAYSPGLGVDEWLGDRGGVFGGPLF